MKTIISDFMEVITSKYARFSGRANRSEFWKYVLVLFIINLLFSILSSLVGGIVAVRYVVMVLNAIVMLGLLVPSLAISARRLHDIGKGAGWLFINFVPIIGSIWFLILMAKAGEGANRFGSPV